MPKNIVICCDGTGEKLVGPQPSNVVKLYRALSQTAGQVAYYHPGIGTSAAPGARGWIARQWTRLLGLAFGYGLEDNIADAYRFLMEHFQPGDQVYLFGFSRGAYTVRALSGMLHFVGLLKPGSEGKVVEAIRLIKGPDFSKADQLKTTSSIACAPRFIGVWDTVSSVGWIYNAVHFPYTNAAHNPDLRTARHAISIDERRAFFRANLFGPAASKAQDVKEVWFAGVHEDVGGGAPEAESGLSQVTLQWMFCEAAAAGVLFEPALKTAVLGGSAPNVPPDAKAPMHSSLVGVWPLCEIWPKVVHKMGADGHWHRRLQVNLGRRREIPAGATIHQSVQQRLADPSLHYAPPNLPATRHVDTQC